MTREKLPPLKLEKRSELESGCKINLCLKITGRRPDGYHTLHSYFLPLPEPSDRLVISPLEAEGGPRCAFTSSMPGLDAQNNTVVKAYRLFAAAVPRCPAIGVELLKNVPSGAGLGGGSANAAALLNFLNSFVQGRGLAGLPQDELLALAARVGADVPFFIIGRPAWVSGIGEVIRPDEKALAPYKNTWLLLLCPPVAVSTPWAYNEWDKLANDEQNALTSHGPHDSNNSAEAIRFENSLEIPVFASFPELRSLKEKLLALGALKAMMSGSGSGTFGIFASKEAAGAAAGALRTEGLRVFIQALYTGASPSW